MSVPEPEIAQVSAQLARVESRILDEQHEGRKKLEDIGQRVARIELMLAGDAVTPGLLSRLLLIESRLSLVYVVLSAVGVLALGTLWALITGR